MSAGFHVMATPVPEPIRAAFDASIEEHRAARDGMGV